MPILLMDNPRIFYFVLLNEKFAYLFLILNSHFYLKGFLASGEASAGCVGTLFIFPWPFSMLFSWLAISFLIPHSSGIPDISSLTPPDIFSAFDLILCLLFWH